MINMFVVLSYFFYGGIYVSKLVKLYTFNMFTGMLSIISLKL